MRYSVLLATFVFVLAGAPTLAGGEAEAVAPVSAGSLNLRGLSELDFNPLAGTFVVEVRGARLAERDGAVSVWLNDAPLDPESVHVGPRGVTVDYRLRPGVNDVLVEARDTDEAQLRTDALIWAGDGAVNVDVVDHKQRPLSGVQVTVSLAEQASVKARQTTASGTTRFENLPPEEMTITAQYRGANQTVVYDGESGSVLLQLDTR